jgi:hypothetical protein
MKALRNALLCALFVSGNALAATAGLFQVPYDTSAGTYGWEGYHMIWYEDDGAGNLIQGYHMGEDWNRGSGSADEGDRLNALADGKVIYVNHSGLPGKGKVVIVRYTLPNGDTVDGVYYHCKTIVVNDNDIVTRGQKIAELGGTFGYVPHLHWQMETDPNLSIYTNPYHGKQQSGGPARDPMTPANALRYTSPSLFVDDRKSEEEPGGFAMATGGYYTIFTMAGNAPSSTAYVERVVTLYRASGAGIRPRATSKNFLAIFCGFSPHPSAERQD